MVWAGAIVAAHACMSGTTPRYAVLAVPVVTATFALASIQACGAEGSPPKGETSASGVGGGGTGGFSPTGSGGGGDFPIPDPCVSTMSCEDFPQAPIIEAGAPSDAPDLFGPVDPNGFSGAPPCVLEPHLSSGTEPGAMVPANWLAPRFRFGATGDLFEIRVSSVVQVNDLVVYTTTPQWVMPKAIWEPAANNNAGEAMTVTIRSLSQASPGTQSGFIGDFLVAPVNAGGSMVFWTVNSSQVTPESSKLLGFTVGDEGVTEVLKPATLDFAGVLHEDGGSLRGTYGGGKPGFAPGDVQCIGCHISTPDGAAVVFTDDWPWNKAIASVEEESAGQIPSYLTPGGRALLKMPWLGTQAMSPAYFEDGNRLLLASYGQRTDPFSNTSGQNDRLIWIDLSTAATIDDAVPTNDPQGAAQARNQAIAAAEGTAWGQLAMGGQSGAAVTPDWSHDGSFIVYVTSDNTPNGHPGYDALTADLYRVPFNDRAGGAVQAIPGASSPDYYEYYPAISPDDRLIAFNRAPTKNGATCPVGTCPDGPYYNRHAEIQVIPADGGTPSRLRANDPVACAGDDLNDGLINSWPKWSPTASSVGGKTYYFLIFSSARTYPGSFDIPASQYTPPTLDTRSSQLYMAAVVVDDMTGAVTSYPGVYLWNQNTVVAGMTVEEIVSSNLTPAWDDFVIPEVPSVPK